MITTRANGENSGKSEVSGLCERRSLINGTANIIERPNQTNVTNRWTESPLKPPAV